MARSCDPKLNTLVKDPGVLKTLLDSKAAFYNQGWFIENDPVSIPHRYSRKEDVEISAFLTSALAWGQRKMILKKCSQLMSMMDNSPHAFLVGASDKELGGLSKFVYRTFNGVDAQYFMSALREIYLHKDGLESLFVGGFKQDGTVKGAIHRFRSHFLAYSPLARTTRHVPDVSKGSAAKRLNMFLRWMVRDDGHVDLGIWKGIPQSHLMIPLDTHVGKIARQLGILSRNQDDWASVEELTTLLRELRPHDPVYYDFALFGMGVYEKQEDLTLKG